MSGFDRLFKIAVLIVFIIFGGFYIQVNKYMSVVELGRTPLIINKLNGATYEFDFNQYTKQYEWKKLPAKIK